MTLTKMIVRNTITWVIKKWYHCKHLVVWLGKLQNVQTHWPRLRTKFSMWRYFLISMFIFQCSVACNNEKPIITYTLLDKPCCCIPRIYRAVSITFRAKVNVWWIMVQWETENILWLNFMQTLMFLMQSFI